MRGQGHFAADAFGLYGGNSLGLGFARLPLSSQPVSFFIVPLSQLLIPPAFFW